MEMCRELQRTFGQGRAQRVLALGIPRKAKEGEEAGRVGGARSRWWGVGVGMRGVAGPEIHERRTQQQLESPWMGGGEEGWGCDGVIGEHLFGREK